MARVFKFYWEIQKRSKLKVTNADATPVTAKKKISYWKSCRRGTSVLYFVLTLKAVKDLCTC